MAAYPQNVLFEKRDKEAHILCVIILLSRDKRRVKHVVNNMLPHLKNYMVLDAFDYKKNQIGKFMRMNNMRFANDRGFLKGQLGCYFSHFAQLVRISQKVGEFVMLEDDAALGPDFVKNLATIRAELPPNYNFCYLYHDNGVYRRAAKIKKGNGKYAIEGKSAIMRAPPTYGTVGYLVKSGFANKLVKDLRVIRTTIDNRFIAMLQNHVRIFAAKPRIVGTGGASLPSERKRKLGSNIWTSESYR